MFNLTCIKVRVLKPLAMVANKLNRLIAIAITGIAITISVENANAQRNNNRNNHKNNNTRYEQSNQRHERGSVNDRGRHDNKREAVKHEKYSYNNRSKSTYHKHHKNAHARHNNYGRYYSYKPWRNNHPVTLKHKHGNYYYHDGCFYSRSGRGYVTIAAPHQVVFAHLPMGYHRVMIHGHLYFRYGDLFFTATNNGYMLTTCPTGITITAHW